MATSVEEPVPEIVPRLVLAEAEPDLIERFPALETVPLLTQELVIVVDLPLLFVNVFVDAKSNDPWELCLYL